jgi:hypothetical protein
MGKVQNAHPLIPGAKITGQQAKGPMHILKPERHEFSQISEEI